MKLFDLDKHEKAALFDNENLWVEDIIRMYSAKEVIAKLKRKEQIK